MTRLRLPYRGIVVRFPTEAGDFYILRSIQTGSGTQPASYTMAIGGKATGALRWPTHHHLMPRLIMSGVISPPPECPHGMHSDSSTWCSIHQQNTAFVSIPTFLRYVNVYHVLKSAVLNTWQLQNVPEITLFLINTKQYNNLSYIAVKMVPSSKYKLLPATAKVWKHSWKPFCKTLFSSSVAFLMMSVG